MPSSKHTTKPLKLLSSPQNSARGRRNSSEGDFARLTAERAEALTGNLLGESDDDSLLIAFIELINGIANEPSDDCRYSLAFYATLAAVKRLSVFSKMAGCTEARVKRETASVSEADQREKVLSFHSTGPHGEDPNKGYHIKVGDKIVVEMRLTVERLNHHRDRTFVVGRANDDGSMVMFDEGAARAIFWGWD